MKKVIAGLLAFSLISILPACNSPSTSQSEVNEAQSSTEQVENKELTIHLQTFNENGIDASPIERTGTFSGTLVNGVPSGEGTFTATNPDGDEWTYTGNFENGTFNGQGYCKWIDYEQTGTFTNGIFTPTKSEFFAHTAYFYFAPYTLTSTAKAYLEENPDYFPASTEDAITAIKNVADLTITYPMLTKSIENYGATPFYTGPLNVLQIFEHGFVGHTTTAALLGDDQLHYYQLVYDGSLPDVLDGDTISVYGLPIASSSFENVSGGMTNVIVIAGSYIEKV
nr:hypothetical protein [uncultured Butyricicoccus sp.]